MAGRSKTYETRDRCYQCTDGTQRRTCDTCRGSASVYDRRTGQKKGCCPWCDGGLATQRCASCAGTGHL